MSTAERSALLEARNVSKYFGNVVALKDISVGVGAGEVTCVLGDNGAGKSTFIKILSGVHREDEGEIRMNGERITFGSPREAKELILDEPTSALGVKQSGIVLRYIVQARERGVGVIFISHNPHHAYPVGDRFVILNRGRLQGSWKRGEISRDELVQMMAGGAELDQLTHELQS